MIFLRLLPRMSHGHQARQRLHDDCFEEQNSCRQWCEQKNPGTPEELANNRAMCFVFRNRQEFPKCSSFDPDIADRVYWDKVSSDVQLGIGAIANACPK